MKKEKEERYTFAKIKIEKIDKLIPVGDEITGKGIERKALTFIATITKGNFTISFNATTLSKLFKEIREEV